MKSTKLNPEELEQLKVLQEKKNQDLLKRFIIDQTESKVKNRFSDKELDTENEKRKILRTIEDLWKIKNIDSRISRKPAEYKSIFTQDYYKEMFRLNNWNHQEIIVEKPWQAGRLLSKLIINLSKLLGAVY
ncbi:MAG: P63C domain-containing protein [Lutibacter sp.]